MEANGCNETFNDVANPFSIINIFSFNDIDLFHLNINKSIICHYALLPLDDPGLDTVHLFEYLC